MLERGWMHDGDHSLEPACIGDGQAARLSGTAEI